VVEVKALEVAQTLALPTGYLGGRWLASKATYVYGSELGFPPDRSFYYFGRGSALGDVHPEVVTSAMTFFPSYVVEPMWREGRAVMDPAEALAAFSECCWRWGRDRLSGAAQLNRTTELLAKVIDNADGASLALFAGWRQAPRPGDLPALAAQLMHVLREFRGGSHAVAVLASGLTPVEAAVAGERAAGVASPEAVGWNGPLPERTDDMVSRRQAAEALTNLLLARAFAGLDDSERGELVEGVQGLSAAVTASSTSSSSSPDKAT
jgi:hypothetical protein